MRPEVADDRRVDVEDAGTEEGVAAGIAERPQGVWRERSRVEPLRGRSLVVRQDRIDAREVRAVLPARRVRAVGAGVRRPRKSAR